MSSSGKSNIQSSQIQVSFENKEGKKNIDIGGRGATDIGLQGDHASAYYLITYVIQSILARNKLSEATVLIFHIFDRLQAKIDGDILRLEGKIFVVGDENYSIAEKDADALLHKKLVKLSLEFSGLLDEAKLKIKRYNESSGEDLWRKKMYVSLFTLADQNIEFKNTFFKESNKTISNELTLALAALANMAECRVEEDIIDLTKSYLTIRNKLPLTSFPAEGNVIPPSGEGARVKTAAKQLNILVEMYTEDSKKENEKNFNEKVAQQIYLLFWYPKIPNRILIDLSSKKGMNT